MIAVSAGSTSFQFSRPPVDANQARLASTRTKHIILYEGTWTCHSNGGLDI